MTAQPTCGRPTKIGAPCSRVRPTLDAECSPDRIIRTYLPACDWHLTTEERQDSGLHLATLQLERELYENNLLPACWGWLVPDVADDEERYDAFHAGRCALCGQQPSRLVRDHSHVTGNIRGYLCRSCNTLEGESNRPLVEKYRLLPPADLVGFVRKYETPFWWAR